MTRMKHHPFTYAVIGDVVRSRDIADRARVHRRLEETLGVVNAAVSSLIPLAVTVGDEFQGGYAALGDAIEAAWLTHLRLRPAIDTRYGIGRGSSTTLDAARGIQDGPAWWAAREAIESVSARSAKRASRLVRTAYRSAEEDPREPAVAAALDCRDHLVGSLSKRSLRILQGLVVEEQTQAGLAEAEGISASAVSQRVGGDGIGVVIYAQERLRGMA